MESMSIAFFSNSTIHVFQYKCNPHCVACVVALIPHSVLVSIVEALGSSGLSGRCVNWHVIRPVKVTLVSPRAGWDLSLCVDGSSSWQPSDARSLPERKELSKRRGGGNTNCCITWNGPPLFLSHSITFFLENAMGIWIVNTHDCINYRCWEQWERSIVVHQERHSAFCCET